MNDFRQDLSAKVMTTQEQSMDSSTTDGEVLKLLCQMKEVQDVMTALNESSVKLTEKVIAFESVVRSQNDKLVGLESSLTPQGQKLSAMDNILSRMNAAKPKAPPPCGPAPDLPATEAPLPPPPSLPPRQWAAASTTPASATPSGVILPTVPGNLVMPGLQLPTGSLPCAPFQTVGIQYGCDGTAAGYGYSALSSGRRWSFGFAVCFCGIGVLRFRKQLRHLRVRHQPKRCQIYQDSVSGPWGIRSVARIHVSTHIRSGGAKMVVGVIAATSACGTGIHPDRREDGHPAVCSFELDLQPKLEHDRCRDWRGELALRHLYVEEQAMWSRSGVQQMHWSFTGETTRTPCSGTTEWDSDDSDSTNSQVLQACRSMLEGEATPGPRPKKERCGPAKASRVSGNTHLCWCRTMGFRGGGGPDSS
eukprot:s527_g22.t1